MGTYVDRECKTEYVTKYDSFKTEECSTEYTTKYETYTDTECQTKEEHVCEFHWSGSGNHKEWVKNPDKCRYVPKETCHDVKKSRSKSVPQRVCKDIVNKKSRSEPVEKCFDVTK